MVEQLHNLTPKKLRMEQKNLFQQFLGSVIQEIYYLKQLLDSFAFITGKLNPRSPVSQRIVQSHLRRRKLDKTGLIAQLSLLVTLADDFEGNH